MRNGLRSGRGLAQPILEMGLGDLRVIAREEGALAQLGTVVARLWVRDHLTAVEVSDASRTRLASSWAVKSQLPSQGTARHRMRLSSWSMGEKTAQPTWSSRRSSQLETARTSQPA